MSKQKLTRLRLKLAAAVIGLWLVALLTGAAQAQDGKSFYAERFDVEITVLSNGDMQVVERETDVFTRGTFRVGFAEIPTGRTEGIVGVQVFGDGAPYSRAQSGERANTFIVQDTGERIVVEWYYPPASNSTHTFELRYIVKGGLRYYAEYGEVWWKAIPPERDYVIHHSTITVRLPAGALILTEPDGRHCAGLLPELALASVAPDRLAASFAINQTIPKNQEVEVYVCYQPGVVGGQAPAWQADFDRQQEWDEVYRPAVNLGVGVLGAALLVGGPLLMLAMWYVHGRDPSVGLVADQVADLPSDLPPGLVGTLLDESADPQDIMATLIDLARRGYLTITEQQKQFGARDFVYSRTDKPADDLRDYEKLVLQEVFGGALESRLSNLAQKFLMIFPKLQKALYDEMIREKFMRASPSAVRQEYNLAGFGIMAMALVVYIAARDAAALYLDTLHWPLIGLVVSGLAVGVGGRYMPHKTRKGAEEAARWRAFKAYLTQIEKYNLPEARERFERYLPFAIAFGLERSMIGKFASVQAPMPAWYTPLWRQPGGGRAPGLASLTPGGGVSLSSLQQMSDGAARSLQNISEGMISMCNYASLVGSGRSSGGRGGRRRGGGGGGGRRGRR